MIVAPAVDLRGGRCVQLVGGDPDAEAVSITDPAAVAERWRGLGFGTLHVVDLDAALGQGDNRALIRDLLARSEAEVQVGGGLRRGGDVLELLDAGASRVIVGTRAVRERDWLEALLGASPGRIVVAVDSRDGRILSHGWRNDAGYDLVPFLEGLCGLPLAGIFFTDVGVEGRMTGIDRAFAAEVVEASPCGVWASGGIATVDDLEFLERNGATGAVLGMSLYTGRLDAAELARRWGAPKRPAMSSAAKGAGLFAGGESPARKTGPRREGSRP